MTAHAIVQQNREEPEPLRPGVRGKYRRLMLALLALNRQNASMNDDQGLILSEEPKPASASMGGRARARALSPSTRHEIAKKAAASRWAEVSQAKYGSPDNPLRIGDVQIECYVIERPDGSVTRVLTQASFLTALGRHPKANTRRGEGLPPILQGQALRPYISDELVELAAPITFSLPTGGRASGYNAEALPAVCEAYLRANDDGKLPDNQKHVAVQAGILVRGLARIGITALVDEATGYQEARTKDALAKILEAFIDKELNAWVSTFPADFYRELFRLRGLDYDTRSVKRPQYFGNLTNNIVYDRLAPGVLDELRVVVPRNEQGRPKSRYFQKLTSNIGYPKLREHLGSVVTIMKLSEDWLHFTATLDKLHPRFGDTMLLPFDDDDGL